MSGDILQSNLNLTPEEKRVYGQLFKQADTEGLDVVTGDVAVKFFERTGLNSTALGEIWQYADAENRGLLTPAGFSVALRLIGHCQAGRRPTAELAARPGPLPKFDGVTSLQQPTPSSPAQSMTIQSTGGPIRVPPLVPDRANEYTNLFTKAGAQKGLLGGDAARQMFERSGLPNDALGRVWNLADTEQRGSLNLTEFIIAMHFITSMRNGTLRTIPQTLPPGLYEAASRRPVTPSTASNLPRQYTGASLPPSAQSPLTRTSIGSPTLSTQSTGSEWLISPQDKAQYDQLFSRVDSQGTGYINGDQAVTFFSNSGLPEDTLASVWDLADIRSEGRLNRDEFAVAMYLIRQQKSRRDGGSLPVTLPPNLVPPSMRHRAIPPSHSTAPVFDNATHAPQASSAAEDLFGLDAISGSGPPAQTQSPPPASPSRATQPPTAVTPGGFKPFQPTSTFGQGLAAQGIATPERSGSLQTRDITPQKSTSTTNDDLLGDNDPEVSSRLTAETTELGNMSNQIGNLRTQMQQLQSNKSATQNDLSNTTSQKRELEARLAQFRTQYEQEVREVRALEEQLRTSRTETQKLQQELAMIEGTHQDLREQHQRTSAGLEADQRESSNLKQRISETNAEVNQLRTQHEKLVAEARQLKGMVAINKKQLATTENERDRIKADTKDTEREISESNATLQAASAEPVPSAASLSSSPTGQSTNPFFRTTSSSSITDQTMSPSIFSQEYSSSSRKATFDEFFGPQENKLQHFDAPRAESSSAAREITEPDGPIQSTTDEASQPAQLSEVPQAPQMNSTAEAPEASGSSSALLASSSPFPFASNSAATIEPPLTTREAAPDAAEFASSTQHQATSTEVPSTEAFDSASSPSNAPANVEPKSHPALGQELAGAAAITSTIPGAFPGETSQAPIEPSKENEAFSESRDASQDPFAMSTPAHQTTNTEFPPIEEVHDNASDSESERGFENDFTPASPTQPDHQAGLAAPAYAAAETSATETNGPFKTTTSRAATDTLPVPQPSVTELDSNGSSHDVTPPPPQTQASERAATTSSFTHGNSTASAALGNSAVADSEFGQEAHLPLEAVPPVASQPKDEFDSAFDDLTEAKEADAAGHDTFSNGHGRQETGEFNPTFDSPTTSGAAKLVTNGPFSSGFGPSQDLGSSTQSFYTPSTSQPAQPSSHDWDEIFSGLSSSNAEQAHESNPFAADAGFESRGVSSAPAAAAMVPTTAAATTQERPAPPARAISMGTAHDDPILKTLTGMGFKREAALAALEKYDYNLDKAADYLTFTT